MPFSIPDLFNQCLEARGSYLQKFKLEAYRLYNREDPRLPIAVDIYADNAVVHVFESSAIPHLQTLEDFLKNTVKINNFFYKNRTRAGGCSVETRHSASLQPVSARREITIREYGHSFLINLSDYLDTGLFLDHRETRQWIAEQSFGKRVLNTFAYTGSFTVYAATAGALKTHSVDLSKTYCDWMHRNFGLNHMAPQDHRVYKMDTLEYFKYAKRKELLFDIIIIDPPTFSRNKGTSFSVQQDHPDLIRGASALLASDGFILFSNNCQDFYMNQRALSEFNILEKRSMIPADFAAGPTPHQCFIIRR
ncbi:class I SAM-dependent methyltransferase [Candidatus Peregrinibacteria bacterium]|nr:class I SAM-dependent methyltransferase [Candidatus Peregrinibacteria bacterium]